MKIWRFTRTVVFVVTIFYVALNISLRLFPKRSLQKEHRLLDTKLYVQWQSQKIEGINCMKIISGDKEEIDKFHKKLPKSLPNDKIILEHTKNCELFRQVYGYNDIINTQEEKDFPLAFNILFYKEVAQVEMLLRSIYRPQNSYCLHVDGFSSVLVHRAAGYLADCFPNVFIVSKTENIVYQSFQRLQADINCMADHLKLENGWKYLINLPGEEFPSKTNLETVRILKALNNTNSLECVNKVKNSSSRYRNKYVYNYTADGHYTISQSNVTNPPPPHNMTVVKGSAFGVFTRGFVHYIVHGRKAQDLLNWCRSILCAEEYHWQTLHHYTNVHVPEIPGGKCSGHVLATYVNWGRHHCHGYMLRSLCVNSIDDLKLLVKNKHLFINKFKLKESYAALQCLGEWITHETHSEQTINQTAYRRWLKLD